MTSLIFKGSQNVRKSDAHLCDLNVSEWHKAGLYFTYKNIYVNTNNNDRRNSFITFSESNLY